jgi:ubiquinone biosynthesis protein
MGTPLGRVNLRDLRAEIEHIRREFLVVESIEDYDATGFVGALVRAGGKFRLRLSPEYAIAIKSIATLESIIRYLDPDVDIVGIAQPYARLLLARRFDPGELASGALGELVRLGSTLWSLPDQLDQALHDFETGNLQLRAVTPELDRLPTVLARVATQIVLTAFASSMTLATAVVWTSTHDPGVAHPVAGVLLALSLVGWVATLGGVVLSHSRPLRVTPILRLFRRSASN